MANPEFRVEGTNPALTVLAALATLALVLPIFTTSSPGSTYSPRNSSSRGLCSLVLYGTFVFIQTVRHRDYFLPADSDADDHAAPPPEPGGIRERRAAPAFSLVAVVGLAKF